MKKLIITTNPNCPVCRDMLESGILNNIDADLILMPLVKSDKFLFEALWKTESWTKSFIQMLQNKEVNGVDYSKDITELADDNYSKLDKLKEVYLNTTGQKMVQTPQMFTEENGEYSLIVPPRVDMKDVILKALKD